MVTKTALGVNGYAAPRFRIADFVKDFQWEGKKDKHVPLGQGRVNPDFFSMLNRDNFQGPISLHVEYLPKAGTQENINALRRDLRALKKWLRARV